MLQIGLTGGIGSGKSTVAAMLGDLGAHVIDADELAREVVEPGTLGLGQLRQEFGNQILARDGRLDRSELAAIVFKDASARARLNAIVHPLVRSRTDRIIADLPADAVVIHDVPLIVENDLAADYHLVLVVAADPGTRTERLRRDRGMTTEQARARMQAQADDDQRRRVADVWIENGDDRQAAAEQVHRFWHERAVGYAANLAAQQHAGRPERPDLSDPPGPPRTWTVQAEAILQRLRRSGGDLVRTADHIGSTAVPGLIAQDVIDLQLGVASLAAADELSHALTAAGFPLVPPGGWDTPKPGTCEVWPTRFHANADPQRAVNLHVRVEGEAGWRFALLARDWLRADARARRQYAELKSALVQQKLSTAAYAAAKEPWFDAAWSRMNEWADRTGWHPFEG